MLTKIILSSNKEVTLSANTKVYLTFQQEYALNKVQNECFGIVQTLHDLEPVPLPKET